ncbi:MAG: arsenite S-adenosylmethyltransferase [Ignavibacteriae bacterium HGW-Ignavibacteriae-3]|nr:MAG: arsenite S-adenosylmethyltransferase [Ignavibacteriae bacterium HGW-Ignavibacteriae-3]
MNSREETKEIVKEKYGQIAKKSGSCCGTDNKIIGYTVMQDKYDHLNGYVKDADLGLGCGLPTEYAGIKAGDTVVDLGSGAGNDVFIARSIAGENGKVIGIDFTEEMIEKAVENNKKLGYSNVEFKFGDIEEIPLEKGQADVVVSNCVLNLVPDKEKAFAEIYRILKDDGHFCVSDIVIKGTMTEELKKSAVMYAGCVSGAVQEEEYLQIIKDTGFKNVEIKKSKKIELPVELLKEYLTEDGLKDYYENLKGIVSITVVGYK